MTPHVKDNPAQATAQHGLAEAPDYNNNGVYAHINNSPIQLRVLNFGKLRGEVPSENNIVYYRRGLEELSLNITNACPNACTFCIRDRDVGWGVSNLYLSGDPTVDEIISAFDFESEKIRASGFKLRKVKICGYGEPILRFNDLFPISAHIRGFNPNTIIQVTTTGWPYFRYISDDTSRLRDLRAAGLTDVYLSLSTPNREVYRKLVRPGINEYDPLAFDDSLRFGIAARDAGLAVTLGFINLAGIKEEDVKKFAEELGFGYKLREFEE